MHVIALNEICNIKNVFISYADNFQRDCGSGSTRKTRMEVKMIKLMFVSWA